MSTTTQVESFCESCGTRYAFEPRRTARHQLVKVGRLVGILADDGDVDESALVVSRDPFHGAFHFCLECRRFTCPTCWDASAGFCRSCAATLSGGAARPEPVYSLDPETTALLHSAFDELSRLGSGEAWERLERPPASRPEIVATPPEFGESPEDDLDQIIKAGVAALEAREAQAAEAARLAAEADAARRAEEQRAAEEAARVAAEQAEAQRLAWEEYEEKRRQYEVELAEWERAEAERIAAERAEAERIAAERAEAERAEASRAEAERLAAERTDAEQEAQRLAAAEDAVRPAPEQDDADDSVWDSLAGALGPDVAPAPEPPPAPAAIPQLTPPPQLPPVPQLPPPPVAGPWQLGDPRAAMPGIVPPPPAGWRPPMATGYAPQHAGPNGQVQLRSGIRPCPRCELALSANARFCRRCGLPQG